MKSVSDRQQLQMIARKTFGRDQKAFLDVYDQAMRDCLRINNCSYGCQFFLFLGVYEMCKVAVSDLIIDQDILSDDNYRLRTGVCANEIPIVYQIDTNV